MKRFGKTSIVSGLFLAAILVLSVSPLVRPLAGRLSSRWSDGWAFKAAYESLALGMPLSVVVDMISSAPEYEYGYQSFRILYFRSPSPFCRAPDPATLDYRPGKVVARLDDLPDIYGSLQLAFDSNDNLCAYTFIGEGYTVESFGGSVRGDHLSELTHLEAVKDAPCDWPLRGRSGRFSQGEQSRTPN